ncbi:hypothetical protein C9I44_00785 [Lactococcus garvieae]|uniref:hypothetical protein n=1 Tax=Lactococcus garvieae TaxID=1363 RepID=UPI001E645B4D|nr:hypothetical protein [Lactococcus garvieae]MDN5629790.1 hypothetical protein [Lactococcus sp.]UHU65039.1 hypothetical protein C9I44_00785 [Lactococcus garvieae]
MSVIDLSKNKSNKKHTGRFRVTIKTLKSSSTLFIRYLIEIEDFANPDYVTIKSEYYTGSDPEKQAQRMVEKIKKQEQLTTNAEVYYLD